MSEQDNGQEQPNRLQKRNEQLERMRSRAYEEVISAMCELRKLNKNEAYEHLKVASEILT